MAKEILTQERLKELLDYDPETGIFTRKTRAAKRVQIGDIAGSMHSKGYWVVKIDNRSHKAHRLAWLYVYGVWPTADLDHVNGIRNDNRICNLREAPNGMNAQNMRHAASNNKSSGLIGASWHKQTKKWNAQITHGNRRIHLGLFDSAEEAHAAYVRAKVELHPFNTLPHPGGDKYVLSPVHVPSSSYRGVGWHKATGKWMASLQHQSNKKHLGIFATEEEAHSAYLKAKASLSLIDAKPYD